MTFIAFIIGVLSQLCFPAQLGKDAFLPSASLGRPLLEPAVETSVALHASGFDTVHVWSDTVAGNAGATVTSNVMVGGFSNIVGMQGTIAWDPAVAAFDSIVGFGLPGMSATNFGLGQVGIGRLTYAWNDATLTGQNVADGSVVFGIQFSLQGAAGTFSPINFASSPTALEVANIAFMAIPAAYDPGMVSINGTLHVDVRAGEENAYLMYPNPLQSSETSFDVSLPFEGRDVTQLALRDMQGRLVNNPITWTASERRLACELGSGLSPGAWILEIEHAGTLANLRILVNGK